MGEWIKKKEKKLGRAGRGQKKRKKLPFVVVTEDILKPDTSGIVKIKLAPDVKEHKKPHSTVEGRKASVVRSLVRSMADLKGGGIGQRGLGRAFKKGGKV